MKIIIMATLVVCGNKNKHIGARPLMLQQTDICIATEKEILMNAKVNLLALWFFYQKKD